MKEDGEIKTVSWLSEISSDSTELVGQKAVRIALLYKQKLPVPPGFVITSNVFKRFIDENELMPSIKAVLFNIKASSASKINEASKRIHNILSESPFPKEIADEIYEAYEILHPGKKGNALSLLDKEGEISVAVRSSPVHEGLDGRASLKVYGKERLIEAVKECFSALFSPENLEKWDSKYINEGVAVIVQPMISLEKEGIAYFSSSQNTPCVVEAVREDSINERHFLNRDFSIIHKSESPEQENVLSPHEIKRAAICAEELAKKSGAPRQVSFGYSKGNLYVFDSVPYDVPVSVEENAYAQEDVPDDSQNVIEKVEEADEKDFFLLLHSSMIREALRKRTKYKFEEKPEVLLALSETKGESEDIEAQVLKALESAKLSEE